MRRVNARPSDSSPSALVVSDLTVHFGGVVALRDVSIDMQSQQIMGIIGPNGAGKTTLFNAVSRLAAPSHGTITYRGRSLLSMRTPQLAGLGIVRTLQGLGLWTRLTVLENVMLGAPPAASMVSDLLALPRGDRAERRRADEAMAVLEQLGVADRARAFPGSLAHGIQKRVVLARALMGRPTLLLLDEPASGLSAGEVEQLVELLRTLRADMGIALVEHHLDMVMAVSDRVTVLNLGRVIASGTPAEIRANDEVSTAYLGTSVAHA
ncbi:MAG: ABC transporter ATP-binding protein [Candidatus Dormibacteraeota bacterium]|uniref:ABC transporter ATP-binding protein n=1 Tax=Candidatus Aeolococcus gillhamiae TaxID=3127015 RepID=A0A2W5ZMK4_9BACT|nr:ABC transporter ATP-binding protein [Candidatus Dormibacteraeota bacterium]PZR84096.1 MAG: ABC transporter ATP-binding protein [Candidatus Dormibacter sp. RRmetagenome_bin12]